MQVISYWAVCFCGLRSLWIHVNGKEAAQVHKHSLPWLLGSWRSVVAILLAFLLAGSTVFSQSGLGDWKNVQTLAPGTQVVVKTVASEKYFGRLVNVTGDSLSIDSDERAFPGRVTRRRAIRRVEVREVHLRRQGASILAGGAIGGGAGATIGGVIEASAKSGEDRGVALVVLTGLGFALGALIGRHANIAKGKRIYVAPSSLPASPGPDTAEDE
jgi:hypothetical protein